MDKYVEINEEERINEIKNSLRRCVEKIATAAAENHKVSSSYIDSLTNMIYEYTTKCASRDLVAFKNHANRKNISEEDVVLLSRKTKYRDHLVEYLEENGFDVKHLTKGKKKK